MIHGVLFVPDLGMALFSIKEATDRGMKATFDNTGVTITKGEKTVATGVRINKHLYCVKILPLQDFFELFTQVVSLQHVLLVTTVARALRTRKQLHHPENV